jgi:DNA-binding FadR family transcriptional regulator
MLDPDVLYWRLSSVPEGEFFRSLITMRRIIEPAAAALAATSGSGKDLARIEAAYPRMEAAATAPDLRSKVFVCRRRSNAWMSWTTQIETAFFMHLAASALQAGTI